MTIFLAAIGEPASLKSVAEEVVGMSVVTRPLTGFYRNYSNDRPNQTKLVRLSESDRVFDEPIKAAAYDRLPDETDTFTLGTEPQEVFAKAPGPEITVEASLPAEDTWAPLEVEKTLGQLMTESRKRRGFSREEAAEQTSIPAYYIRMIESDCYDAIPDQLYLLPFFQRYAIFLGIDAQQVVARFIRDFEKAENELAAPPAPKKASQKVSASNVAHRWRRIAEAAAIVGILLPLIGWEVGRMRVANQRNSGNTNIASISTSTKSLASIQPSNDSPAIVTAPAAPPREAVVPPPAPEKAVASAAPVATEQIAPAPQAPIRSRRRSHTHRLSHHLRHLKRGIS
jgi:cytoskeletal protein RodZ